MSKKQTKNVQLAAEPKLEKSENAEGTFKPTNVPAEATVPEPVISEEDKLKQQLAEVQKQLAVADANFKQISVYLTKLEPLIPVAEKMVAMQQQGTQNLQAAAPQGGGMWEKIAEKVLSGEGSSPIQAKMNKLTDAVLDKAIANVLNPEKPLIQKYLEEETAKKIAKALAEHTA